MRRRDFMVGAAALASYLQIRKSGAANVLLLAHKRVNWVAEGDSITLGLGGTPAWPFVALSSMPGASPGTGGNTPTDSPVTGIGQVHLVDIATSGISLTTIDANYSTRVGANFVAGKTNVLAIMAGTNGTETVNQLYTLLRDIVRRAHATGFSRVVVGTTIARDDDGGTKWTTTLQPFNALIRTYWNNDLDVDGYIDFGADAKFSTPAAADNLTYYISDKLHPNVAGEAAMGAIAEPVVLAALQGPGTRVTAAATWSPFDISGSLVLSNSNRTVAWPGAGFTQAKVRGLIGKSSGKWYWEAVADTAQFDTFGMMNQAQDATNNALGLNNSPNALGWGYDGSGNNLLLYNSTTLATISTIADGDIIQHAVDIDAALYWTRKSTGNWNGNGSANPATGIGGVSISAMKAASSPQLMLYPAGYIRSFGSQMTSKFALAQMSGPVPSGFTALDQ